MNRMKPCREGGSPQPDNIHGRNRRQGYYQGKYARETALLLLVAAVLATVVIRIGG